MTSVTKLESIGRIRLSPNFFLREFLYSEISQAEGIENVPSDLELATLAGQGLCENILEPIQAALGKVSIRSAYRSAQVNKIGNGKDYNCASNEKNYASHIWDVRDAAGNYGATACIVVNSFVDYYAETGDWPALAWWLYDHIPSFRHVVFYPKLAAFNINWYSGPSPERSILAQVPHPETGKKGILVRDSGAAVPMANGAKYAEYLKRVK
ncbi:MAG: peptidase M15 [Pseudomonadales bacterium]